MQHRRGRPGLGLPAVVEHEHPVAHLVDHRRVAADEEHGETALDLELAEQVQHGSLRQDVERTRRVDRDQQPGVRRVVLLGETPAGGASLVAAVQPSEGIEAADLIKAAAKAVGGGGGGKGDIATAGGKDPSGLDEAMRIAAEAAAS